MMKKCVLVVESHALQRNMLVNALSRLHVACVLSADNTIQAIDHIRRHDVIDIIFFDLSDGSISNADFLRVASHLGNVRTLALYGELALSLRRTVENMSTMFNIRLLGILEKPLKLETLQKIFIALKACESSILRQSEATPKLIPYTEVLRGLMAGEFQAWYQPKFNLHDGRLFGVEVLFRWERPQHGLLMPRDLLASVVAYDLIDVIFKQLLEKGLKVMSQLRKQGIFLGLAFNLNHSQLVRHDLIEHITQRLHQYEMPGSAITFEIAENGMLGLSASATENLFSLNNAGCGLSIDNFGIGFSSLKQLTHLPFNQLKLDGAFAQDVDDLGNRAVISSSIALARALKMDLVVKGIESPYALTTLISLGCSFGQGYHLAPPMTATDLCVWLKFHAPAV